MKDTVRARLDEVGKAVLTLSRAAIILAGLYAAVHYHSCIAVLFACGIAAVASIGVLTVGMFVGGLLLAITLPDDIEGENASIVTPSDTTREC